jgi:hypothetical protein
MDEGLELREGAEVREQGSKSRIDGAKMKDCKWGNKDKDEGINQREQQCGGLEVRRHRKGGEGAKMREQIAGSKGE